MRDWLIALPVWGERYRKTFAEQCLPSWREALKPLAGRVRFMMHTDDPSFASLLSDFPVDVLDPDVKDASNRHEAFARAHRAALFDARPGEIVALQNADHVLSADCFTAAEKRIDRGFKMVMCAGTRTVGPLFGNPTPTGMKAADLLHWAMVHLHPIVQQCVYPHGKTAIPSTLYFSDGRNTILRAWHLHPFAVVKDRTLDFNGTIDRDLCDAFEPHEIHVVTTQDELAMAEISPLTVRFPLVGDGMTQHNLADWAERFTTPMHAYFFGHRIVIEGTADTDCDAPADALLLRMRAMRRAA